MIKVIEFGGLETEMVRSGRLNLGECVPYDECRHIFRLPYANIANPECIVYWLPARSGDPQDRALNEVLRSPSTALHEGPAGSWMQGQTVCASDLSFPILTIRFAVALFQLHRGRTHLVEERCAAELGEGCFRMHRHEVFDYHYVEFFGDEEAVMMKLALTDLVHDIRPPYPPA